MTDPAALSAFEALVQGQAPASTPWQPVTDYSFEARRPIEEPHAKLIAEVFRPQRVLDAGCGPGHLVRLLREGGVHTVGADLPDYDVTDSDPDCQGWYLPFDLVICREVLEHLTIKQIAQAVRNLCRASSRFVYVTTRFHPNPTHLLDVATSDDLDPTHITLLNQDFLRLLFVLEGCTRRADLEQLMDWQHKGRVLVYERAR